MDNNSDEYIRTGFVNPENTSDQWIEWSYNLSDDSTAECVSGYACENEAGLMDLM